MNALQITSVHDADETLRCVAHTVTETTRWKLCAAAIRAWATAAAGEPAQTRFARVAAQLNFKQRSALSRMFAQAPVTFAADEIAGVMSELSPSEQHAALLRAGILWAQQEARGARGVERLLDQVIPVLDDDETEQLAAEAMRLYAADHAGSIS
jgi:hypothetical protein